MPSTKLAGLVITTADLDSLFLSFSLLIQIYLFKHKANSLFGITFKFIEIFLISE